MHASKICNFEPKCVKYAEEHLTPDCLHVDKITPKYSNCGRTYPATYRGCSQTPQLYKKRNYPKPIQKYNSNQKDKSNQKIMAGILANFSYTKKKNPIPQQQLIKFQIRILLPNPLLTLNLLPLIVLLALTMLLIFKRYSKLSKK